MRAGARVGDKLAAVRMVAVPSAAAAGPLAGGHDHGEQATGGGVEDHAAARAGAGKPIGQAEQCADPVEHVGLEFGAGRRRGPEHALHAQPGREQLAEDRRPARARREVGEESGVLPVCEGGRNDAVEVGEYDVELLGLLGRLRWQLGSHPAWLDRRLHRLLGHGLPVVGNPVDDGAALTAEAFGIEDRHRLARHTVTPRAA